MNRPESKAFEPSVASDIELMLRVKNDDALAFEALVARYQQPLLRLLTRYLRDAASAEDATQEVFLKVYQARKRYEAKSKFSTWLYRIALNTGSSYLHRQRRAIDTLNSARMARQHAPSTDGNSPSEGLRLDERSRAILSALDSLTEPQRVAVILSRYEGLKYSEVAATMGISQKAVKSLVSRAHMRLSEVLRRMLPED